MPVLICKLTCPSDGAADFIARCALRNNLAHSGRVGNEDVAMHALSDVSRIQSRRARTPCTT